MPEALNSSPKIQIFCSIVPNLYFSEKEKFTCMGALFWTSKMEEGRQPQRAQTTTNSPGKPKAPNRMTPARQRDGRSSKRSPKESQRHPKNRHMPRQRTPRNGSENHQTYGLLPSDRHNKGLRGPGMPKDRKKWLAEAPVPPPRGTPKGSAWRHLASTY